MVQPFSFFQTATLPYFRFWSRILPSIKFKKTSSEISGIIALEALNVIIYLCIRLINLLIVLLNQLELERGYVS